MRALAAAACVLGLGLACGAAARAEEPGAVDVRAFGDAGFIAGPGVFGPPPKSWVEARLGGIEDLRSPDVNFLNLEGALTRACRKFQDKQWQFAIAPEALAQFARWGFNLVSLANNHTLDCVDPPPHLEIDKALADARRGGATFAAHGLARTAAKLADAPATLTVRGVTIGMVSLKIWEGGRRSGVGNGSNRHDLMAALKAAKVDVRILSLHGGTENTRRPADAMIDLAREFVARYDGDVVFAHHPHRMQGFELLTRRDGRTGVVFYSLGNFLHNGLSAAGDGMAARVAVTRRGVDPGSVAAYPLGDASARPGPVRSPAALKEILAMLRASNAAVALKPLPAGLQRLVFSLSPVQAPLPGWKLVPGENSGI